MIKEINDMKDKVLSESMWTEKAKEAAPNVGIKVKKAIFLKKKIKIIKTVINTKEIK